MGNYPKGPSAMIAMRYTAFSERLSTPTAGSSRINVFVVHRNGLMMFIMLEMDCSICEGSSESRPIILVTFEPHDIVIQ